MVEGLRIAGPHLSGIGIDTWGADYGLLDADGRLLANPVNMRDRRTEGMTYTASRVPSVVMTVWWAKFGVDIG